MYVMRLTAPRGLRGSSLPCVRVVKRTRVHAADNSESFSAESPVEGLDYQFPPAPPSYPTQQYYTAVPPSPQPQPVYPQQASSGPPFWVWIIVGIALHWIYTLIQEFRKNPLAAMMGLMGNRGMPKPPPGGATGGGFDPAMMEMMMKNMSAEYGRPAAGASSSTTINTTASDVAPRPAPAPENAASTRQQDGANGAWGGPSPSTPSARSEPSSTLPSNFFTDAAAASTPPSSSSFFSDTSAGPAATPPPASFFTDTSAGAGAPPPQQEAPADPAATEEMVDNMLLMMASSPEMQAQCAKFLPPELNNEQTWVWVRSNPAMRRQMAKQVAPMLQQQLGSTADMNRLMNPANPEKAMEQMRSMGVDPDAMLSKLMQDPEAIQLFTKPHVQQALMEMQRDPAGASKYMGDPDVMKLLQKMVEQNPGMLSAAANPFKRP